MRTLVFGLAGLMGVALASALAGGAASEDGAPSRDAAEAGLGTPTSDAVPVGATADVRPAGQAVESLKPLAIDRTERLLENRIACLGCHRIAGRGGQIGPSLEGLDARVDAAYVRSVIRDPAGVIPGTIMPRQPMPEAEIERLTAYLLSPPAADSPSPLVAPEPPAAIAEDESEDGAALYARHCAACHGSEGRGDGWNAPNLPVPPTSHADAELMSRRPDDSLFDAIHGGAYVLDGSPRMPPFGAMLSAAQIRALVSHIRTLCDCAQPEWAGGP